jgi:N-acetylmuramoyl-L-alanine amidase
VLAAYRAVYHADPAAAHADASVEAVAELLSEEGRLLHDRKASIDAIGQYEFLRREYPGSRFRESALLAEGEIYARDLGDRIAAQASLKDFLRSYPRSASAAQARAQLAELKEPTPPQRPASGMHSGHHNAVLDAAIHSQTQPHSFPQPRAAPSPAIAETAGPSAAAPTQSRRNTFEERDLPAATPAAAAAQPALMPPPPSARHGGLPLITGVRHWSTPVYTRVAIDIASDTGDPVQYEASRVPNPERIFFDLHGVKLSPQLLGRAIQVSTQVTDDGYLKRIRVAQFSGDVVRIVLDVSAVSDYSAFFLPNPSRLIVDIHGRAPGSFIRYSTPALAQANAPPSATSSRPSPTQQPAQPPQAAPAAAPATSQATAPPVLTRQARTGTVPPRSATPATPAQQTEIAALDQQPNRVKATRHPTTAPVAASVADTTPAPQPDATLTPAPVPKRSRHRDSGPPDTPAADPIQTARAAQPTSSGERSMVRALGLKIGRIVVDAGHGGHDSGTLGPGGIEEKDVVLDVALRLGKLLKQRLGADVIYTRDDDTFIPLETRTAIANKAQADLFISVHANSSQDSSARGVETYYLNFTTSADALEVAARENAVSDQSIHQLSDLVRKITLQDKISESREFASDVEQSLYSGLEAGNSGLKDRGVKKAPFVVLIGANMPSILAEISFLTNPDDAHQLRDPEYRQRIAESLYRGVAKYVGSLSGVRLASGAVRPTGE